LQRADPWRIGTSPPRRALESGPVAVQKTEHREPALRCACLHQADRSRLAGQWWGHCRL